MSTEILNALIGLVLGLVTGFYFERRATRQSTVQRAEALEENKLLRQRINELEELLLTNQTKIEDSVKHVQESVYSTAKTDTRSKRTASVSIDPAALLTEIRAWVDVDGTIPVSAIKRKILEKGHPADTFDDLLKDLTQSGEIRVIGKSVKLI